MLIAFLVFSPVCSVLCYSDIHYLNFSAGDPISVFHMDDDWSERRERAEPKRRSDPSQQSASLVLFLMQVVSALLSLRFRWYGSNGSDVGFFAAAYVRLDDAEA